MGVAKKGRGNNFQNCSTSSKVLYGCQLVISGEKSFLARSATIIPFGPLLYWWKRIFLCKVNCWPYGDQKLYVETRGGEIMRHSI